MRRAANSKNPVQEEGDDDDDQPLIARRGQEQKPPSSDEDDDDDEPLTKRRKPRKRAEALPDDEEDEPSMFKEGQIKVCPPLGDAQRAFYESLLEENPRSIIAIKYCVEQGVLIGTKAKEALCSYKRLKEAGAFKPPLGSVKPQILTELFD